MLGAAVLSRCRALAAVAGEPAVSAAQRSLPADLRARLESVNAVAWIALDDVEALTDAVAHMVDREPEAFHDEVIRRSVDDALLGIYRFALRFATDAWLVSRTPSIFLRTRSLGRLVCAMPRSGEARLTLTEWPGILDRHARQVAIGVERMLVLTGREGTRVTHVLNASGAVLDVTWRTSGTAR